MGMDVYGRKPSSEEGVYFRASVWQWRPIHALLDELCRDVLDSKMRRMLAYNTGAGPREQSTCDAIAARFDQWLEHRTGGYSVPDSSGMRVAADGLVVDADDPRAVGPLYCVDDAQLREWVQFLRACGGFTVM